MYGRGVSHYRLQLPEGLREPWFKAFFFGAPWTVTNSQGPNADLSIACFLISGPEADDPPPKPGPAQDREHRRVSGAGG